jgi:integrase
MAVAIWTRKYGFQLRVSHKLLPKDFWATFDTREAAEQYGRQLDALLAQGIVPAALLEAGKPSQPIWTVQRCVAEYRRANAVPDSDLRLLDTLLPGLESVRTNVLNYDWAEGWVRTMKREHNLAPSTIRHRHGALARCFDWMVRKHADVMPQNPLRLLKRGFATYNEADAAALAQTGRTTREDEERDRRLEPDEETRILAQLESSEDERVFFVLALETGMRMRECYTLLDSQVSLQKRTIALDRTKNGDNRQVPMSSTVVSALSAYMTVHKNAIRARSGRLFPFWNGQADAATLKATTSDVSARFAKVFDVAGAADFHFHDLRHEATCRLYLRTRLSDVQIAKIIGHRDLRMLKRYASLRGSDLADQLW